MIKDYSYYKNLADSIIIEFTDKLSSPSQKLVESVKYSLLSKGKRLRPVLFLSALDLLNSKIDESAKNLCFMIESLHTYTLIHDDLPCMDNDETRRGTPTNHIVFGQAHALLAGDALLNLSIEHALKAISLDKNALDGTIQFFKETGINGVIAGQAIEFENPQPNQFLTILENKTAKLFKASLTLAGIKANTDKNTLLKLQQLGYNYGMAFQLKDDLTDSDGKLKNTPTLLNEFKQNAIVNAKNLNYSFFLDLISLSL